MPPLPGFLFLRTPTGTRPEARRFFKNAAERFPLYPARGTGEAFRRVEKHKTNKGIETKPQKQNFGKALLCTAYILYL
jgi:hypothetical protein